MKIAFLNIYQNRVERGAETFVLEVSKRLSKNHQVEVFTGGKQPLARWPIFWRAFLDPNSIQVFFWSLKLLPKILKEKYDIVIPVNGGWQPAIIRLMTWLYGGKMVISGQSGIGWDDRNNLWSFPDTFVALSTQAKKWAKKVMPLTKSVYIPNGVDITKFKSKGAKYKTKLQKPIILCVGALTSQKRIDLVVKAASRLKNSSLIIAAGDKDRANIKKLGKKLLGDRFELIDVPFEKMPEIYRSVDLFTLVSESTEAFGNVFVEAMATNLAVVAVGDEQRQEIVGNAGIFVEDPNDMKVYAKALKKALKTNWGDKPRKQAKKFDWDKIAEKYEELFKRLTK